MPDTTDKKARKLAVGQRLRTIRKELRLRQQDLAGTIGVTQAFITGIERMGSSVNWLMTGEGDRVTPATVERILAESQKQYYARLYGGTFHASERTLIVDALVNHNGNRVADALGVGRFCLLFLEHLFGIPDVPGADAG